MERYLREKLQWGIAKDKEKSGIAEHFIGENSRENENQRGGS